MRQRRGRILFFTALFSTALLALPGPAPAQDEGKTLLTVWGQSLGPGDKGLEDVVREFERRNPDIKVRMLTMGAGGMNPQKLMTAVVGGVPPDVIHTDRFQVNDWAARDAFIPLDEFLARDQAANDPLVPRAEDYFEGPWNEVIFDGKTYAIPTGADNRVLYVNMEVFAEEADTLRAAGLDPTRPPRTWSEMHAYNKALTTFDSEGRLTRAGFLPNFGNAWLYMYAFQNNADFMSPDGRRCTLNTEYAREALQFMIDGYDILGGFENANAFAATFRGGINDPFATGRVVMKIDGDWSLNWLADSVPGLDFITVPAPVPDDRFYKRGRFANEEDTYITWGGGFSYAIPRGAKNVEAAWEFIKFATSLEGRVLNMRGQQRFMQIRGRLFIPKVEAHKGATQYAIDNLLPAGRFGDALRTHMAVAPVMRMRPPTFAGQVLWDEHVRATDLALRKTLTPDEALRRGQEKVQRNLDEVFNREQYAVIDLRIPSFIGLFGALIGAIVLFAAYKRQGLGKLGAHEAKWGYLFIAPWALGFLIFTIGPMLASFFFAFTQYNVMTEARWVGVKNFIDLFTVDQQLTIKGLLNVLYLGGIGVPLGIITGLAVAMLLNTGVRGMRFYRTMFYLPSIVPGIASIVLWMWLLNPDPNRGVINMLWTNTIQLWLDAPPPGWLGVEAWAKPSLILMGLWGAGGGMILWLAGLKGVPNTLYEAASIDGADHKRQFWAITVPQLSPIIFFNVVMGFIGSLQTFDNVYIITNGQGSGPNDSLMMPVYQLFTNGFNYFKMGYASALAWVIFAAVMAITAIQFVLARYWVHYEVQK